MKQEALELRNAAEALVRVVEPNISYMFLSRMRQAIMYFDEALNKDNKRVESPVEGPNWVPHSDKYSEYDNE